MKVVWFISALHRMSSYTLWNLLVYILVYTNSYSYIIVLELVRVYNCNDSMQNALSSSWSENGTFWYNKHYTVDLSRLYIYIYIYIYNNCAHSTTVTMIKFQLDLHSRTTPHTSPLRSLKVIFLSYTKKNDRDISKVHCTMTDHLILCITPVLWNENVNTILYIS